MKFTQTTRLIAVAVLIFVVTAVIWWVVGFHVGAALLDNAGAWRSFGYGQLGLMRLLALAIIVTVTIAVVTSVSPQTRWLAIAAVALGATMLYGDKSRGDIVAVVLLVLAAAAMTEAGGVQQIVTALVLAILISLAALADLEVSTPHKIIAILVRAFLFYTPLLLGPTYMDKYVMKRISK